MSKAAAVAIALAITASIAHAAVDDSDVARRTLRGLRGVAVGLTIREGLITETDSVTIRTDTELALRNAGVTVLNQDDREKTPGMPLLLLTLEGSERSSGSTCVSLDLQLIQQVILARESKLRANAPTWSVGAVGALNDDNHDALRSRVRDMVAQFLNAYLAANPKKSEGVR